MPVAQVPEISIVVPILNEAEELYPLYESLLSQNGVRYELLLCDGGSSDGSLQLAEALASGNSAAVRSIRSPRGRGRQMNAAAAIARAELLLFLHADSRFIAQDALSSAVTAFGERQSGNGNTLAARFALRFRRQQSRPSLAYSFYEAKARLNRADCIRGDQGFMLTRTLFDRLGGFDESLPFLEDVRLAFAIAAEADWMLLPAEISTSARRFESEGLYERQVVNAIIANALVCGWSELFSALPGLYRCSGESGRLLLFPLLDGIRTLLSRHPLTWRISFWHATGRHVADNIWQLFFWLDVRRSFRDGAPQTGLSGRWSRFFEYRLQPFVRTQAMAVITAAVVWLWHRSLLIICRNESRKFKETS
jgi:rSAM/selenodomain-associated transferase 2